MYINLLYLLLFNFAYLFFLFFLCFPLNIFVSFIFITLFPNWHIVLVLFSSLCFSFVLVDNFCFPLFIRSIYYTLFLLNCFDFAYGYTCFCVYSVTLSIVVINLCLYIGLLLFCGLFLFSCLFFFSFLFIIILFLNFLNLLYFFYIYSVVCLSYCSFPIAVNL